MKEKYKINGKEIEKLENLITGTTTVGNIKGYAVEVLRGDNDKVFSCIADKINELLEALSDKEEKKQSTSLKEDRNSLKYQISYLLWNENNFTKEETDRYSDKILSLIQSRACENCKHKFNYENNN